MKTASSLFLLACLTSVFAAENTPASREEGVFSPKEKPLTAYDTLRKKSPFEFDPPKPPVVDDVNPFDGISLAGYCGNGNTLTVYLLEGKEKKRITVFGDGSPFKKRDSSGFRVIGINRGKSLKTTEIILEKDGRQGPVKFDEDALRSNAAPGGGPVMKGPDGKPIPRPPIPKPAGAPAQQGGGYQAPAPYIPGVSNAPQTPAPGAAAGNGVAQPVENFQVLPGQKPVTVNPAFPNGKPAPGAAVPKPARRVVLPTQ
jgi:hypothetical protein